MKFRDVQSCCIVDANKLARARCSLDCAGSLLIWPVIKSVASTDDNIGIMVYYLIISMIRDYRIRPG